MKRCGVCGESDSIHALYMRCVFLVMHSCYKGSIMACVGGWEVIILVIGTVCVCVYFTRRGTNSVMLVPIPFFSFSVRLREGIKLQAHILYGSLNVRPPRISARLSSSPTPFNTTASQGLAHISLMWMEHEFRTEASTIKFSISSDVILQNTRLSFLRSVPVQFIQE